MKCVFCQIVEKNLEASIIYEDEKVLVIKDIYPKAEQHLLFLIKKHVGLLTDLSEEDYLSLFRVLKKLKDKLQIHSFSLAFNEGKEAGQLIPHVHMHLLSGKKFVQFL